MWRLTLVALLAIAGCSSSAERGTASSPGASSPGASSPGASSPGASSPAAPSSSVLGTAATSNPSTAATTSSSAKPAVTAQSVAYYRPSHVVVVMEENKDYSQVIGASSAPYIQALARGGALLTSYYAITHPSEPNYQALFAGSTLGLTSDACPVSYNRVNLGSELRSHGHNFLGYAESLPYAGSKVCTTSTGYARRHCPWVNFTTLPGAVGQPFTAFPTDYTRLPALSFVIPNVNHDMHDGTVAQGDTWLHDKLGPYASWSRTHNSLLVVLWDESETSGGNHVAAIVYGARVIAGHYATRLSHYSALRLFEDMFGLPRLGYSATAAVVPKIFS